MRMGAIVALCLWAGAQAAGAETLPEAMADAAQSNPTLAAQRERLRATREALPQAWSQALPQLSISAGAGVSQSHGAGASPQQDTFNGSATASQLLFASGGVLASTRQARAQIAGALADYDGARQQLLLDVASAYAGVRQAQEIVAARQTTVSNLTELQRYAGAQFDAGLVTRTDVAQADARLAQAQTQLVQAQGQLAAANEAYMRLVGHPPNALAAPGDVEGVPASLQDALDLAVRQNPFLISTLAAARAADAALAVARSDNFPTVSLQASSSLGGELNNSSSETSQDSIGVRMSWSLFNGGLSLSRVRQQRALRSAANLDVAAAERSVHEDVTNAWTGLMSARAALASAQQQVQASEIAYRGVRLEHETGLRSTIDVLNQEQDLLDARLAQAQAERDLVVAERQMLAVTGSLTPQ